MNLFDKLVDEALKNQPQLSSLRTVVEKELLHHDILKVMRDHQFMTQLTFIGGTCLRSCYGGVRLSEDLDFTGGQSFSKDQLSQMGSVLIKSLHQKYGLTVSVSEPEREQQMVDTWKIKMETRPDSKHLPAQRINIDICTLPSYEKRPRMILNPYGVDMGTGGLIIQAQSREEIFSDKLIAFALRLNRMKYRDLWDIAWLHGKGVKPNLHLIPLKLQDRQWTKNQFLDLFAHRLQLMKGTSNLFQDFIKEMSRFLPVQDSNKMIHQHDFWEALTYVMEDFNEQIKDFFSKI